MQVDIVKVPRRPDWPGWAVAIVAIWLGLVGLSHIVSQHMDVHGTACMFRRITGYPCPTCGATRGVVALLQGDLIHCWLYNPFLFSIGFLWLLHLSARLFTARAVRIMMCRRERAIVWFLATVLLMGNWAYLIYYHLAG